jgi:Glycosyl transferase family 2
VGKAGRVAIVVPTRNRAELAIRAVRSTLDEVGRTVTVIVSDNSTDPVEVERLRAACEGLGDGAVTYVQPPEPLAMPAHWQWALRRALEDEDVGHVAYLTDRMVFKRGWLAELLAIVASRPTDVVTYNHDSVLDHARPIRLRLEPWSGLVAEIPSERLLLLASSGVIHASLPRMLNSVVPRAVLDGVEQRFGTVFASIAPDFCFAFRCLATIDHVLFWDASPLVQHGLDVSNGATYQHGVDSSARRDFDEQLGATTMNYAAPVPEFETIRNVILHEYAYVREEAADGERFPPIDPRGYLAAVVEDLSLLENREVRSRMLDVLADTGWVGAPKRRVDAMMLLLRAMYLGWDVARAGSRFIARVRPGAHFDTSEAALARAETTPRPPEQGLAHLPAFADLSFSRPPLGPRTRPSA